MLSHGDVCFKLLRTSAFASISLSLTRMTIFSGVAHLLYKLRQISTFDFLLFPSKPSPFFFFFLPL
ncbi:hypothetical protein F383_31931 [Gossypium arboreum]|uniref:Uncharacterized protein n=1 Tax=Gossypium arboreum TaxID=29729 RepID=A0A0B0MW72_GOSAR|nr:hypothetical protein F383_31931 [Gossypium arboreum]